MGQFKENTVSVFYEFDVPMSHAIPDCYKSLQIVSKDAIISTNDDPDGREMLQMKRIPRKKAGRPTNRPDPEYLITLYEKLTAAQIAEMYHVSASTVRSWVARLRKEYEQNE